ncbi:trace amine-associated receptor 13c-like [Pygocentrus nattereri]|uniref:trace amine-associated receptor 13c-like n=1 Tax=Pygocentrus nattereri TaxID=42514 RepID=UPI001890ECB7|nr:trace amine-associated receptor 13c-like [Pygocentrus nattereri]
MNTEDQINMSIQYCFPGVNSSCRKELHTPTNLLILSLAVADLLVGLIVMPVKIMELIDSCWYLGKIACSVSPIIYYLSMSASLCSLIFIAVDRYIAVSDPLLYSTRVTVYKMSVFIMMCWSICSFYAIIYLYTNDHLLLSQISSDCYGECVVFVKYSWVISDLVIGFLAPCSVILVLYSIIFNVARRQARAVRAVKIGASKKHRAEPSHSSETKAAKTLGIIVFVYLACWIPFYVTSLSVESVTSSSMVWTVFGWLLYMNSSAYPLIYAMFYPWLRESAKRVLSCGIFKSFSFLFHTTVQYSDCITAVACPSLLPISEGHAILCQARTIDTDLLQ